MIRNLLKIQPSSEKITLVRWSRLVLACGLAGAPAACYTPQHPDTEGGDALPGVCLDDPLDGTMGNVIAMNVTGGGSENGPDGTTLSIPGASTGLEGIGTLASFDLRTGKVVAQITTLDLMPNQQMILVVGTGDPHTNSYFPDDAYFMGFRTDTTGNLQLQAGIFNDGLVTFARDPFDTEFANSVQLVMSIGGPGLDFTFIAANNQTDTAHLDGPLESFLADAHVFLAGGNVAGTPQPDPTSTVTLRRLTVQCQP